MTASAARPPATVPVVIAGGGPAGLAAAAELDLHAVPVIVIEPRTDVSHRRPRAKTTSIRTMEHLRRWGLAGALRAAAPLPVAWSQRVTFCESLTGRRVTDFDNAFGLTTQRDDRFAEAGQQVPQPVVEDVLRAHLARRPGVELRFGHAVSQIVQDRDGVTVTVSAPDGARRMIRTRYLLGCDGAAGICRDAIGASYAGRADSRPNFNVVFRAPGLDTPLGPAVQYWVVARPGGTAPGGTGPAATGLIGRLDLDGTWWAILPGIGAADGAARASQLITGLIGAPAEHEVLACDPWTARLLVADSFADRRVFLVGESAHVNPPWGGHGFNTSVGDAVNIGWKIAAVEHGWAGPELLASYEAERRSVVEQTVASAESNMRSMAGDLPADAAAIQQAKRAEFHSLGLVLGYTYAGSPAIQPGEAAGLPGAAGSADICQYQPASTPGSRLPHAWLPDGSSLYDGLGPGFALIGPAGGAAAALAGQAARRGIPLRLIQPPPGYPWRAEYLLVRPDQHVAWRATDPAAIDLDVVTGWRAPLSPSGTERGR